MARGVKGSAPSCLVPECCRAHKGHGYCAVHLRRFKAGTLGRPGLRDLSFEERFWRFVAMDRNGCWAWTGFRSKGYGRISKNGNNASAHRVSWELNRGEIPNGLEIDHLCRNPRCVNPDHLEPVTQRVNTQRARAAVTHCPEGHEYTPENTSHKKLAGGYMARRCLTCHREREAVRRRARRAESSV